MQERHAFVEDAVAQDGVVGVAGHEERFDGGAQHAVLAGSLTWEHRDPFDRFLAAQAIIENVTLVTRDVVLTAFPEVATLRA